MRAVIIAHLQRLLSAYSRVSDGWTDSAPAYVARFAKRVLTLIKVQSMPASPTMNATASFASSHVPQFQDGMGEILQSLVSRGADISLMTGFVLGEHTESRDPIAR